LYAPVLISVYDRIHCLEACTNSLKANEEADKTDLYIAIDYPSKKEDVEKVRDVICFCQNINGFKSVNIIERKENVGPSRNIREARKNLLKRHSTLITVEDDNVVSTNFLLYMNGALKYYREFDQIFCICGYNFPVEMPREYEADVYVWPGFNAYGVGWWREKIDYTYWNYTNFGEFVRNPWLVSEFMKVAEHILPVAISGLRKGIVHGDAAISYNLFMNKKYQLYPSISKVKNIGYDGKGVNCNTDERYLNQIIDNGQKEVMFEPNIKPDPSVYTKLYEYFKVDGRVKVQVFNFINSYKENGKQGHSKSQSNLGMQRSRSTSMGNDERLKNGRIISPVTHYQDVSFVRDLQSDVIINEYQKYDIDVSGYFAELTNISVYECDKTGYRFFYPFNLEGDGAFYAQLERIPWYYMDEKWEFQKGLELISDRERVLEIGCGAGAFLKRCSKLGIDICGLEINKSQCERLWADGYKVLNRKLTDISNEFSEYFDIVCAFQVLEHIFDVKGFIENSLKMLRKDGRLILSVPNHDSFMGLDDRNALDLPPHHMRLWGEDSLSGLERVFKMRLQSLSTEPLQSYHMDYYKVLMNRKYYDAFNIGSAIIDYAEKYSERIKGFSVLVEFVKG